MNRFALLLACLWLWPLVLYADIDDVPVGSSSVDYADPEFLPGGMYAVFQTVEPTFGRSAYFGRLDPVTGQFASGHGKDIRIDAGLPRISGYSMNGPEFGRDVAEIAVVYTKADPSNTSVLQTWKRSFDPVTQALGLKTMLTSNAGGSWGTLPSFDSTAASIRFMFGTGTPGDTTSPGMWADEFEPNNWSSFPGYYFGSGGARAVRDRPYFTYVSSASGVLEAYVLNTDTGQSAIVSCDGITGQKREDAFGFLAIEASGQLHVAMTLNHQQIAVYAVGESGCGTRVSTLDTGDPLHPYIWSLEALPFGANGNSVFIAEARENNSKQNPGDIAIMLWHGLDSESVRLDEGALSAQVRQRIEPEFFTGGAELFVYYSVGGELRRARTGIPLN